MYGFLGTKGRRLLKTSFKALSVGHFNHSLNISLSCNRSRLIVCMLVNTKTWVLLLLLRNTHLIESRWPNEYDRIWWAWPKNSHRRTLTLEHDQKYNNTITTIFVELGIIIHSHCSSLKPNASIDLCKLSQDIETY